MEVKEAIYNRRSIRDFKETCVEHTLLQQICDSALWSPTAGNGQPWAFVIVTEEKMIKKIKTVSPGLQGTPKALIIIFSDIESNVKKMGKEGKILAIMDCSMAAQNIVLRAYELGIGSCVVRSFNQRAVHKLVKAMDNYQPELIITLGYAEKVPAKPKRKTDVIYWENMNSAEDNNG